MGELPMQKILLIGELGEIIRSINECLVNDFQVQLCSEQMDMVKGMAKIVKPDMMIVCQIGIDELDHAIFTWAKEEMPKQIRFSTHIATTRNQIFRSSLPY